MSLPAELTSITVAGTYVDFAGTALSGTVTFTPPAWLQAVSSNMTMVPSKIVATLDSSGAFSVSVPASNDPDMSPVSFTYMVTEEIGRGEPRTYYIDVPYDTSGVLYLSDVSPVVSNSGTYLGKTVYNVRAYGAVGDGTTDDSTAIQAAIAAASAAGGGTVFAPTPTVAYKIDVALIPATNVDIVGSQRKASKIICDDIDAFAIGTASHFTISNFYIANDGSANTLGYALHFTGSAANVRIENVTAYKLGGWLKVDAGAYITHGSFEFCYTSYSGGTHLVLADGAIVNSVQFADCRFEATSGASSGHVSAVGSAVATGGVTWVNCVFESAASQYAVECGDNVGPWTFRDCHFENNASGQANGADVHIGGGRGTVIFDGCTWSPQAATATAFHNIVKDVSTTNVIALGNKVTGQTSEYGGFASASYDSQMVFIGNTYTGASDGFDYLANVGQPVRIGEAIQRYMSHMTDPIVVTVQTTDATQTALYSRPFVNLGLGTYRSHYLIADVVCVDDAGAQYAAYTLRLLATGDTTTSASRGTIDETAIESDVALDCAFSVSNDSNGTIQLLVTGLAATTLQWVASIRLISAMI